MRDNDPSSTGRIEWGSRRTANRRARDGPADRRADPPTSSGPTRRSFLALAGSSGLAATAGCLDAGSVRTVLGEDAETDQHTIGMIHSESGSLAAFGRRNERGLRNALTTINAVGIGDSNEPLIVEVENDESNSAGGLAAARRLVEQVEVPLLVGSIGSGVSMDIYEEVVDGTDVVQVSQHSTSAALSDHPNLLRTAPSGTALGNALATLVAEDGHDSVAISWIDNDYGSSLSTVFENSFEGSIAYEASHEQGADTFESDLDAMADSDASAWLFLTYGDEFETMMTEAYERGYHETVDYYGAESTISEQILANTPAGSQESLVGVTESAPVEQESYQSFSEEFRSIWGSEPTVWAAYTYDAVTLAAIAIEAADAFTGEAIAEVVRDVSRPDGETVYSFADAKAILEDGGTAEDVNYEGVSGPLDVDGDGDPQGFYQVFEVTDHDYEFTDFVTG